MEIWKDIPGYEGDYQASSEGRIRSVDGKTTWSKRHDTERRWKGRVLKQKGDRRLGLRVSLWKDGKPKYMLVARLVAMAFIGMPKDGDTVNHIDGNRLNNNVENLEWLSLADNIRHGFRTGLFEKNQKPVVLKTEKAEISFPSLSAADRFLGRKVGYVHNRLKYATTAVSAEGVLYEISV